jgi:hypothetical protein
MIEVLPNGQMLQSFEDWSPMMIAITLKCHRLPSRSTTCLRNPELGIDMLNRMEYGEIALDLLAEHVEDFEYCPDYDEIIEMGKALIKSHAELQVLTERRRRDRAQYKDRANARARRRGTPKFGYRRGN